MWFSFDFYIYLQTIGTLFDVWYQSELVKNIKLHRCQLFISGIWQEFVKCFMENMVSDLRC